MRNFLSFQVVDRVSETQLEMGGNLNIESVMRPGSSRHSISNEF